MQSPDDEIIHSDISLNQSKKAVPLSAAPPTVNASSASMKANSSATFNEIAVSERMRARFYTNSAEALSALPPSAASVIKEVSSIPILSQSLVEASNMNVGKLSVEKDINAEVILDAQKKTQPVSSQDNKLPAVIKQYYSAGVMVLVPEASSPALKKANNKLWNEPSNNLAYFQRETLEAEIVKHLFSQATEKAKPNTPPARRILTLYGLSGTGKTLLAINTIYRPADYETRCWFDAKNISTLKDQFANFAKEMNIVSAETPVELAYKKAKDWLKQNPRSLLIFDNAEDYKTLSEYLPNSGVDILITSLNNNWPGTVIEVPVFNLSTGEEYVKFLLESDDENIATLVNKFGGHPLALAQAAAYIKGKETVASYLKHYEAIKVKLLEDESLPPDSVHEPIAISWNRIMQAIKEESEEALEILYICAFLHGDNIPEKLIKAWLKDKIPFDERFELSEDKLKAKLWEKMHGFKKISAKYSILKINSAKKSFVMHKLLQDVVKQQMDKQSKEELLKNLLKVIYFKFSVSTRNKRFFQQRQLYIPHLEGLIEYCQQAKLENIDFYFDCLNALGVAYISLEDRQKKKAVLLKALAFIKNSKREKELDIEKILINLSFACQHLQEYENARAFLNEALTRATTIRQSSSFRDYNYESVQIILACNINLGLIEIELNNHQKSIEILKNALKRCLELSNGFRARAESIWKLGTRANVSVSPKGAFLIYANVGLKETSIDKYSRVSIGGSDDNSYDFSELLLIITLTHLGNVYYQQGLKANDYCYFLQSKAYLDKALQHRGVMGNKMHPARAIAFMHLGKVHQQLRLYAAAEANFINSLQIVNDVFDDSHLNIAECFNNLYELYKGVGHYPLAMQCINIALRISTHNFTDDSEELIKIRKEKEVCQAILSTMQSESSQLNNDVERARAHVKKLMTMDFSDEDQAPTILPVVEKIDEKLLEDLIKNLSDDDADIRQSAAQILIKLGRVNVNVLDALIKNLGNDDWSMRRGVVKILENLGELNNQKVFDAYAKNLSSHNRSVRKDALIALNRAGHLIMIFNAYLKNLSSDEYFVRRKASKKLEKLGKTRCPEVINAHIKNLNSDNSALRQQSAEALINLGKDKQEVRARNDNLDVDVFSGSINVHGVRLFPLTAGLSDEATSTPVELEQAKQKALETCIKNLDVNDPRVRQSAAKVLIENNTAIEKVIDALIRNFGDGYYLYEASNLLEKLGRSGDQRVIDAHMNNLNSDDSSIVRMSIEALFKTGKTDQKIVDACIKNLNDKERYTVEQAAETLLKLGKIDNNTIEILFNRLNDEDHCISRAAKEKLIKWGKTNPLVVDFLINKLSVCVSKIKGIIAEILSGIGNAEEKVVKALFPHLADEDDVTRQSIAESLSTLNAETEQVVEIYILNAKNSSIYIRKDALQKLGNLRKTHDKAIETLINSLSDEDSDVRECAENSLLRLKKIDDLRVRDACLLNLKSKHSKIRQFGIEMIGRHNIINDQHFEELIKCLSDDFKSIRRSALETIEKLGKSADPKVIAAHIGNLIHPAKEINLSSIEALGKLENAGDDVINALKKCSSSNKDYVSKVTAAEVIKKLSSKAKDQHLLIIDAAKKDGVKKALTESTDTVVKSPEISRSQSLTPSPALSASYSPSSSSSRSSSPVDKERELNRLQVKLAELKKKLAESTEVEDVSSKKTDDNNAKNMQSRHAIFNDKKALDASSKIQPPLPSQEEIQRNYLISMTKQEKGSEQADEDDDLPDAVKINNPSLHDSDHDSGNDDGSQKQLRP